MITWRGVARWLIEGTVIRANQSLLERAFARAGLPLRVAILKEAEELTPPQPWLAGIVRLGLEDADEGVRSTAAALARTHGLLEDGR